MSSTRPDALLERADRVEQVRHEQPVDDEARVVVRADRLLAERVREGEDRLEVASEVAIVRTTSTSFITGTGLKKCSPAKRSGRCVAVDISVIVSDEVLEQKIVSACRSGRAPRSLLLDVQVLDDRLDDDVAVGQVLEARRPESRPRGVPVRGGELPFSTALPSEPSMRAIPFSTSSSVTSRTTSRSPPSRATSAMPEPIRPAPSTPTFRIVIVLRNSSFGHVVRDLRQVAAPRRPPPQNLRSVSSG